LTPEKFKEICSFLIGIETPLCEERGRCPMAETQVGRSGGHIFLEKKKRVDCKIVIRISFGWKGVRAKKYGRGVTKNPN